jgi:hypothetical protein
VPVHFPVGLILAKEIRVDQSFVSKMMNQFYKELSVQG